jgi:hypothetical protein
MRLALERIIDRADVQRRRYMHIGPRLRRGTFGRRAEARRVREPRTLLVAERRSRRRLPIEEAWSPADTPPTWHRLPPHVVHLHAA